MRGGEALLQERLPVRLVRGELSWAIKLTYQRKLGGLLSAAKMRNWVSCVRSIVNCAYHRILIKEIFDNS